MGPAALPELASLYRESPTAERTVIAQVFYNLGWKSEDAKRALMADVHTPDPALRLQVQWALGRVSDDPAVIDVLLDNMRNDPVPLFRDKAACALAFDQVHLSPAQKLRLFEGLIGALDDSEAAGAAGRDPGPQHPHAPDEGLPSRQRRAGAKRTGRRVAALARSSTGRTCEPPRVALGLLVAAAPRSSLAHVPATRAALARPVGARELQLRRRRRDRSRHVRRLAGRAPQQGRPRTRPALERLPRERAPLGRAPGRRRRRRLPRAAGLLPGAPGGTALLPLRLPHHRPRAGAEHRARRPALLPAREGRHRLLARHARRPPGALLGQHSQAALRCRRPSSGTPWTSPTTSRRDATTS